MTLPDDIATLQTKMATTVHAHWKAFLIEGILLVVLGLAAMIVPPLASIAVTIFLGWMFLVSGVEGLGRTGWRHLINPRAAFVRPVSGSSSARAPGRRWDNSAWRGRSRGASGRGTSARGGSARGAQPA